MQSPLREIIVYDLETGGLDSDTNPITEIAMVAVNLESLEITEEFSVMFQPRMDLSNCSDEPTKEAKAIFNDVAIKDETTGIKTLIYKGRSITPKTVTSLSEDIEEFMSYLKGTGSFIVDLPHYMRLQEGEFKDISTLFLDRAYNKTALEITHMSIDLLIKEGVPYEEGFKMMDDFIKKYTVGNNKPIISGHNIKAFDNKFMVKLFNDNKSDFFKGINAFIIDTLDMVRLRWMEMPSYSLGVCANALGLTLKEAHRALPDTVANAKLLIKLIKTYRGEGSQDSVYVRPKFDFNF